MERILVGVDGSSSSTAAAVWAAGEAAMRDIELTVVHVVAPSSEADTQTSNGGVAQGAEVIDDALDAVIKKLNGPLPRITCKLRFGPVMPTLWEFTQDGAQMIVLGRHGRGETGGAGLGPVTDGMLRTARCPVAVVPPEPVSQLHADRSPVVVGVNTSPASQLAIAVAFDEAARRETRLVAVTPSRPHIGLPRLGAMPRTSGPNTYARTRWPIGSCAPPTSTCAA